MTHRQLFAREGMERVKDILRRAVRYDRKEGFGVLMIMVLLS